MPSPFTAIQGVNKLSAFDSSTYVHTQQLKAEVCTCMHTMVQISEKVLRVIVCYVTLPPQFFSVMWGFC